MHDRNTLLLDMTREFGLQEQDIYLLDLIPLIEMIWVDGERHQDEVELLHEFALQHLRRLSAWCDGISVVSSEDVTRFINRFLEQRPSPALLKRLRNFVFQSLERNEFRETATRRQEILNWCLDIAACTTSGDGAVQTRICQEEKALLTELMKTLKL